MRKVELFLPFIFVLSIFFNSCAFFYASTPDFYIKKDENDVTYYKNLKLIMHYMKSDEEYVYLKVEYRKKVDSTGLTLGFSHKERNHWFWLPLLAIDYPVLGYSFYLLITFLLNINTQSISMLLYAATIALGIICFLIVLSSEDAETVVISLLFGLYYIFMPQVLTSFALSGVNGLVFLVIPLLIGITYFYTRLVMLFVSPSTSNYISDRGNSGWRFFESSAYIPFSQSSYEEYDLLSHYYLSIVVPTSGENLEYSFKTDNNGVIKIPRKDLAKNTGYVVALSDSKIIGNLKLPDFLIPTPVSSASPFPNKIVNEIPASNPKGIEKTEPKKIPDEIAAKSVKPIKTIDSIVPTPKPSIFLDTQPSKHSVPSETKKTFGKKTPSLPQKTTLNKPIRVRNISMSMLTSMSGDILVSLGMLPKSELDGLKSYLEQYKSLRHFEELKKFSENIRRYGYLVYNYNTTTKKYILKLVKTSGSNVSKDIFKQTLFRLLEDDGIITSPQSPKGKMFFEMYVDSVYSHLIFIDG